MVDATAWTRHEPAFIEFRDAVLELREPMLNPPNGFKVRASWERARSRLQALVKRMQEAVDSPEYREAQEAERRRWQDLADAIRRNLEWAGNELAARHFDRPESLDDWVHLARIVEMPDETVRAGELTPREIFAHATAWADRQKIKAKLAADAGGPKKGDATTSAKPAGDSTVALLRVFTNGLADERIKEAARLLELDGPLPGPRRP